VRPGVCNNQAETLRALQDFTETEFPRLIRASGLMEMVIGDRLNVRLRFLGKVNLIMRLEPDVDEYEARGEAILRE